MEQQQDNILKSAAKENKQVLEALQKGMKENTEVMKQNVEMLKIKIGAKTDWFNLTLKLFFKFVYYF